MLCEGIIGVVCGIVLGVDLIGGVCGVVTLGALVLFEVSLLPDGYISGTVVIRWVPRGVAISCVRSLVIEKRLLSSSRLLFVGVF